MNIGYVLQGYPVLSQTWVQLEVKELQSRGYNISIIDTTKNIVENLKISKEQDFLICHFVFQGEYIKRFGVPFGVIAHAFDIWPDNGDTLVNKVVNSNTCKFVGAISEFHRSKYKDWGIKIPILDTPVCCDTEYFHKTKPDLGDKIIAGGRDKEKKGLVFAIEGFPDIYVYGKTGPCKKIKPYANYLGWISKDEYRDLMDDSWLYVSPNTIARTGDMDGQPTTIKEAMLMELQVLTTPIAATPELKYIHTTKLKDIMGGRKGKVFNTIPKERNTKGRDFIKKNFNPQVCVDKILAAIETVI